MSITKNGQIYLTETGIAKAEEIYDKHCKIKEFLETVLDVPSEIAENDACCIEHVISAETFENMKKFMRKHNQ